MRYYVVSIKPPTKAGILMAWEPIAQWNNTYFPLSISGTYEQYSTDGSISNASILIKNLSSQVFNEFSNYYGYYIKVDAGLNPESYAINGKNAPVGTILYGQILKPIQNWANQNLDYIAYVFPATTSLNFSPYNFQIKKGYPLGPQIVENMLGICVQYPTYSQQVGSNLALRDTNQRVSTLEDILKVLIKNYEISYSIRDGVVHFYYAKDSVKKAPFVLDWSSLIEQPVGNVELQGKKENVFASVSIKTHLRGDITVGDLIKPESSMWLVNTASQPVGQFNTQLTYGGVYLVTAIKYNFNAMSTQDSDWSCVYEAVYYEQ